MIKIGIRNNLLYPLIFSITVAVTRIISILLREIFRDARCGFLLGFFKFIFEFILGGLFSFLFSINSKSYGVSQEKGIQLIQNNKDIGRPDSYKKIYFLMTLAALFEYISTYSGRFIIKFLIEDVKVQLINIRLRNFEIIASSLLSYYILKIRIYRHQYITLNIIGISLTLELILEFISADKKSFFIGLLVLFISTITSPLQDIIEKYLFEKDFLDIFKLTAFEGLVGTFLSLPLFSIKNLRDEEVKKIFHFEFIKSYSIIICIIICSILCGFKSIYQKKTLIQYSPNTRAFAEGIWDPGFIIYSKFFIKKSENLPRFIVILILSIIIDFCACVYNEFLVLYCCGMEYETFIEVNKRNIITKIENDTIGETFSKTITNEEEKENENENEDNMFY